MASANDPKNESILDEASLADAAEPTDDFLLREAARITPAQPGVALGASLVGRALGRFRVVRRLGVGGMGEVYLAEDTGLRRHVALKVLPEADSADQERRRRFLREARAATAVVHQNITTIYEVGQADGLDYIAMEHVKGETLRRALSLRDNPFPIPEALRIACEIARGLGKAHESGIVHRDIKPENVMLDEQGSVKILDFGLAKWVEPEDGDATVHRASTMATMEGQILGTPSYMSPEQAEGRSIDARTDVFSLGVMIYEMVAGKLPFHGPTMMAIMIAISRDTPTPITQHRKDVPRAVEALVAHCMAKDPAERFPNGNAVADALDALLSKPQELLVYPPEPDAPEPSEPAPSVPQSLAPPAAPLRRRSALPWIAAIVAPLAIGAALGAASVLRKPAQGEAQEADASMLRVCVRDNGEPRSCAEGIEWCHATGQPVVCCAEGLIPHAPDNACLCAPGGTNVAAAIARGCKASTATEEDRQSARRALIDVVLPCFQSIPALEQLAEGSFSATYMLDAGGKVLEPQVRISSIPNEEAQRCALENLRKASVAPPRAEDVGRSLGFGFVFDALPELRRKRQDAGIDASAAAAPLEPPPPEPPLRFPCAKPPKGWPCAAPNIAWCDIDDQPIACCAKGLMAVGKDGLCACPPGGVTPGVSAPPSCPQKRQMSEARILEIIRPHFGAFRGCYQDALRSSPKIQGRISIRVMLTPEGRVFKSEIMDASLPDTDAQSCLLKAFQTLVFDPPADGSLKFGYPLLFSPGD